MLGSSIDLNNLSFHIHEVSIYTRRKLRQFSFLAGINKRFNQSWKTNKGSTLRLMFNVKPYTFDGITKKDTNR
jgi:hypothetical protein